MGLQVPVGRGWKFVVKFQGLGIAPGKVKPLASPSDKNSMMRHRAGDRVRPLTYDETKAAEAAFQGEPFNPDWSDSARVVYDGLRAAIAKRRADSLNRLLLEFRPDMDREVVLAHASVAEGPSEAEPSDTQMGTGESWHDG